MESSEEEDIIKYDEDDYGEFVIKNNNAILITKGNKSKNQEIVNNSINMGAEPDKLCIKNDGNEKENLNMCEEMVGMLPIKIDKVNRGEEFI